MTILPPLPRTRNSLTRNGRLSWSVTDYLEAPHAVRLDLRTRYAEALAAYVPPSPSSHVRVEEYKRRPTFRDPAGELLAKDLAEHLAWEIRTFAQTGQLTLFRYDA